MISIPTDFKYRDVFLAGRPVHDRFSSFYAKHPPMPPARWAKIFSPFDALRGFSEAVSSREELYEYRRVPDEEVQKELDRKLDILKKLAQNSKAAKANRVKAAVTCYVPCTDPDHEAYGRKGKYIQKTGIVRGVDTELQQTITLDTLSIPLQDITDIMIFASGDESG